MRRTRCVVTGLVLLFVCSHLRAQVRGSLRQTLESLRSDPAVRSIAMPDTGTIKCGTPYVLAIHSQWSMLAPESRARLSQVLQGPVTQKSRVSLSGKFRIHYDTTGFNQPALIASGQDIPNTYEEYIDSVAAILDYVWAYEIDTLGYDPPPLNYSESGLPEYDVYVQELASGLFGYTQPLFADSITGGNNAPRFPSYLVIDNDYLGLRTPGMNGLRVTCAHEFHHAIQVGAYGIWTVDDFYFNELTSSWMEDVVYTQVNDYYYDIQNYFGGFRDGRGQALPFNTYTNAYPGYERDLWAHFLSRRYSRDIMKEIWTGIHSEPFLFSARDVFARHGSDWKTEFALFTYWNYFTADRADTVRFYPEGKHYPRFVPNFSVLFSGNTSKIVSGAYALSSSMFEFNRMTNTITDTITIAVANIGVNALLEQDNSARLIELDLSKGIPSIPYVSLSNGINVGFSVANSGEWHNFYFDSSSTHEIFKTNLGASPNPLHLSQASRLLLPVPGVVQSRASVYFLTTSLTMAYWAEFDIKNEFGYQLIIVPSALLQSRLSSGVYFVIAKAGDAEFRWKVAVVQ